MLDSKIKEEESAHALILPPVEDYPFSEEDSDKNIVLEESQAAGEPPLIQVIIKSLLPPSYLPARGVFRGPYHPICTLLNY